MGAVDNDDKMLRGCGACPSEGIACPVPGLIARLAAEGLAGRVTVSSGDFMEIDLEPADAVWTSGCLQYSANSHHDIAELTDRLRQLVRPNGLAFLEYMIPDEPKLIGRPNCPPVSWWQSVLPRRGWDLLSHGTLVARPDRPHPYVPFPHSHSWGRILVRRR